MTPLHGFSGALIALALTVPCAAACGGDNDDDRTAAARGDAGVNDADRTPSACAALDGGTAQSAVAATCRPAPETDQLQDGVVGSACAADVDCCDGRCLLSERVTGAVYPDGYCTGRCIEDGDCGARGLCTPGFRGAIGACRLRCADDVDCGRDGYRCRVIDGVGRCAPGPEPLPDHVVGNACASDGDCGGGAMTCNDALNGVAAPDGYCSESCAIDDDCGDGGVCISGIGVVSLATGVCYKACSLPEPCRDGYSCRSLTGSASDPRGVCAPDPSSDAGAP